MSAASITMVAQAQPQTVAINNIVISTCQKCGAEIPHSQLHGGIDAQQRIEELEAQVKILTLRATEAVERATDYEDALRAFASATPSPLPPIANGSLQSSRPRTADSQYPPLPPTANTFYAPPTPSAPLQPPSSRLSRLLPTRKPPPTQNLGPLTAPLHSLPSNISLPPQYPYPQTAGLPTTPLETELLSALTREQQLRAAAESAAAQTNSEIEELTGQLFEQANEMVAAERREKRRLEEKVAVLERREGEKARRLGVLEGRLGRIDRVRGLLGGSGGVVDGVEAEDKDGSRGRTGGVEGGAGRRGSERSQSSSETDFKQGASGEKLAK